MYAKKNNLGKIKGGAPRKKVEMRFFYRRHNADVVNILIQIECVVETGSMAGRGGGEGVEGRSARYFHRSRSNGGLAGLHSTFVSSQEVLAVGTFVSDRVERLDTARYACTRPQSNNTQDTGKDPC